jgi:hypothetical protein
MRITRSETQFPKQVFMHPKRILCNMYIHRVLSVCSNFLNNETESFPKSPPSEHNIIVLQHYLLDARARYLCKLAGIMSSLQH